jgi:DNA polymerase III subunit epsilon
MIVTILDTETTDLITNSLISDEHQPRVTEFYGVQTNDQEKELAELEFLCNPRVPIPAESTKITGINDDMVKDCPPFPEFNERVRDIIESSEAIVAHNISYDRDVLDMEFRRAGLEPIRWPRLICTVEASEWLCGFRLNLTRLYMELFNETFPEAHRAKGDVTALKRCYHHMRTMGWI